VGVLFVVNQHPVGAFLTDAADEPFCITVGSRRVHRAGAAFPDEQSVESAQRDDVDGEEVGGQQTGGLSAQEASPAGVCSAWCWPEAYRADTQRPDGPRGPRG
jgi:hypothetical protein